MAESQSLARRAADEGACEAWVHLNIQSEIKMCLERCQRKRSGVYFSSLGLDDEAESRRKTGKVYRDEGKCLFL